MRFKLGLAQLAPRLGDLETNLRCHLDLIARAEAEGADLLVFPELGLSGYYLRDLAADVALDPHGDHPLWRPLVEASARLDLIIGFPETDARHRYYISAAYLAQKRVVHVHRKVYLPTYRLFDDARFFGPGDSFRAFDTRFGRMGLLICEDAWHLSSPYLLWQDGADFLVDISASPGYGVPARPDQSLLSQVTIESFLRAYAELLTTFVIYVNRVGVEDGITFWGGSGVFGPDGERLGGCGEFDEALALVEVDTDRLRRARWRLPTLRDERPELVHQELTRLLRGAGK